MQAHGSLPRSHAGCEVRERSDTVQGKHCIAIDHETECELCEVLERIGYCRQLQAGQLDLKGQQLHKELIAFICLA